MLKTPRKQGRQYLISADGRERYKISGDRNSSEYYRKHIYTLSFVLVCVWGVTLRMCISSLHHKSRHERGKTLSPALLWSPLLQTGSASLQLTFSLVASLLDLQSPQKSVSQLSRVLG